jgi:hypothetical protein
MNLRRFAVFSSVVLAMSLPAADGFADRKYNPPPSRPTVPFNNSANQKPYSGLKPVPAPPGQQGAIKDAFKGGKKGAIKDDFKAQAERKGPYTAVKKSQQTGTVGQRGKNGKVPNVAPGGNQMPAGLKDAKSAENALAASKPKGGPNGK